MIIQLKNSSLAGYIAAVVVTLMAAGTVFVFSADVNISQELSLEHFYDFPALRQILFFPLAVIIMTAVILSVLLGWLEIAIAAVAATAVRV